MKISDRKGSSLAIVVLLIVVIVLVGGIVFLALRYETLDEKYDRLEEKYENGDYTSNNKETVDKTSNDENNNSKDTDNKTSNDESNNNKDTDNKTSNTGNSNKYISRDEALEAVLKDLNVKKEDLHDLDVELENKMRYDNTIYEVSFDYNRYEYEYYVDAVTGEILDSFQSRD